MAATNIIAGITKSVKYNRANRDFDCYVTIDGGEPLHIGYANGETEGNVKCDQYAFDYLSDNNAPEAAAELVLDSPTLGSRIAAARADVLADEDVTIIHLDIRTEAERRYDMERDGTLYVKPAVAAPTYEERFAAGFKDGQAIAAVLLAEESAPVVDHSDPRVTIAHQGTWTEYAAGNVELTYDFGPNIGDNGPFTLYIYGEPVDLPITLDMISGLMIDLGYLLSNDRVQAQFRETPVRQAA